MPISLGRIGRPKRCAVAGACAANCWRAIPCHREVNDGALSRLSLALERKESLAGKEA